MKVALSIVFGLLLLYLGVSSLPDLVVVFQKQDGAYFFGSAIVVIAELAIGLWLFLYGILTSRKQRGNKV